MWFFTHCTKMARAWCTPSRFGFTLAVAGLFSMAFFLQVRLLASYDYLPGISLLFLPHGIRVLAVLIGRGLAVPGLFLSSLAVAWSLDGVLTASEWGFAVISAVMPYAALRLVEVMGGASLSLQLNIPRLLVFVVVSALLNALGHVLLFALEGSLDRALGGHAWLSMGLGDIGGGALCIGLVWVALKTIRHWVIEAKTPESQALTVEGWFERIGVTAGLVLIAFYALSLLDDMGFSPIFVWSTGPLWVLVLASWFFRGPGLIGWTLGVLSVSPSWLSGGGVLLIFSLCGAVTAALALRAETLWPVEGLRPRGRIMRHGLVVTLLFATAYGVGGFFVEFTSDWVRATTVMGFTGILGLGLVVWPFLCLADRVTGRS